MRLVLVALLCMPGSLGLAQRVPAFVEAGITYVALEPLAAALGHSVSASPDSLTVRTPQGVLTVFAGSADVLWQDGELSLSAPTLRRGEALYAPEALLGLLGLEIHGEALEGAATPIPLALASSAAPNSAQLVELGPGVTGLSLFAPGQAGPETLNLLVVDAGLLALLTPEATAELDRLLEAFEGVRPLYFVLSALAESAWQPHFVLEQNGTRLELRHPFSVSVLEGDAGRVGPEAPVAGVLLLPQNVNLRQPLTLWWQGQGAAVQFRR